MQNSLFNLFLRAFFLPLVLVAQPALSLDLSYTHIVGFRGGLDFNANVGIDKPTRDLLAGMPEEVRKQFVEAIKEVLPLLDESIAKFIKQLDEMMSKQIINLQCAIIGTGHNVFAQGKQDISGKKPTPIRDLKTDVAEIVNGFGFSDGPDRYFTDYGDLLFRSQLTVCTTQIFAPILPQVYEVQGTVLKRYNVWNRIHFVKCDNVSSCFNQVMTDLLKKVSVSDARDLNAIRAKERIAAVVRPLDPGPSGKWDPTQSEQALAELFEVDDGIDVARSLRQLQAQVVIDDVAAKRSATQAAGEAALSRLQSIGTDAVLSEYVSIWDSLTPITQMENDVKAEVVQATNIAPENQQAFQTVQAQYDNSLQLAKQDVNVAHARYNDKLEKINNRPATGPRPCEITPVGTDLVERVCP
jgi:hypothetical protein